MLLFLGVAIELARLDAAVGAIIDGRVVGDFVLVVGVLIEDLVDEFLAWCILRAPMLGVDEGEGLSRRAHRMFDRFILIC